MTDPAPTLLFLHVPRTGGTTVSRRLGAAILHARQIGDTYDQGYKEFIAGAEGKARVIASHFPYGAHELLKGLYEYATVLREPLARTGSCLKWQSLTSSNRRFHQAVKERGVFGLLESPIEHNPATKLLSGVGLGYAGKVDKAVFTQAVKNLDMIPWVGFTEELDVWLRQLCLHLGLGDGPANWCHRTGGGSTVFEGDELAAVKQANFWDLKLYEHARASRTGVV
jgi:hypothetical protein